MMKLTDPGSLLEVWESTVGVPEIARAAVMAHRAGLVADVDTALDLSLGECAVLAVRGYVTSYGPHVDGVFACTSCGVLLEVEISMAELAASPAAETQMATVDTSIGPLAVKALTVRDLLTIRDSPDLFAALLDRCLRFADGGAVAMDRLSPDDVVAIDDVCESLAGLGGLTLTTECSSCGECVETALDPAALWFERVEASARLALTQVASLARAFGWTEADVLALTPERRAAYLELVSP